DDVWRRKALLFVEAELFALTGDLTGLGRTCDAIGELAAEIEGWRPWHAWAQAELHKLRGDFDAADDEVERALRLARPGEHRAFLFAAPLRAELRLARGDAESAVREANATLETIAQQGLDRTAVVRTERVRALAQSALGNHDAAETSMQRAFALARELEYGGLPLAALHEAHARIALAAGKNDECLGALGVLHDLLAQADAPAFIHAYEALRQEAGRLSSVELPSAGALPRTDLAISTEIATQVRTRLATADERVERAMLALKLLLEDAGASVGHLFLFDSVGLFAAASTEHGLVPEALLLRAKGYLEGELEATEAVTMADVESGVSTLKLELPGDPKFGPLLLAHAAGERQTVTGVALIATSDAVSKQPRGELVRAISHCLVLAGDSVPQVV
ncbi:MAG: hypothetical protein ACHQ53_15875, partial [Polyangiales bacterium]